MNNIFERNCVDKVAITHIAMEIHFQTTDHVGAVEKVAEQHIGTKYSKCNSLRVISHIIIVGKSDLPKMCNCSSFREKCVTHASTDTHTWCKLKF